MANLRDLFDCTFVSVSIFRNFNKQDKPSLTTSISTKENPQDTNYTNYNAKINSDDRMFKRGFGKSTSNGFQFESDEIENHYYTAMNEMQTLKDIATQCQLPAKNVRISKCYNDAHETEQGLSVVVLDHGDSNFTVSVISGDEIIRVDLTSTGDKSIISQYKEGQSMINMKPKQTWMEKQAERRAKRQTLRETCEEAAVPNSEQTEGFGPYDDSIDNE